MKTKNIVAGLGEIGNPILKLLSKNTLTVGYDVDSRLMNLRKFKKYKTYQTTFLHVCIPFSKKFNSNVQNLFKKFNPHCIVIHSTVKPHTTKNLQKNFPIPVIYSATRGVHRRMLKDLKLYTKFFALEKNAPRFSWAVANFSNLMKKCNVKTKKMSDPLTLELAKIVVDTSYYGWLINFAQLSNMIAQKNKVNYDEMWSFADEIHKNLGNRPKMFPGFIGGHCVIPNLSLIQDENLDMIDEINNFYLKNVKNAKLIAKKYVKGKQSYDKK